MKLAYRIVNVFTRNREPLSGNPLCVFEHAEGTNDTLMQQIARQFSLSETTFVLPSTVADARVRIFTPSFEMPFAGHPTLGTAHVVGELLQREQLVFEMKAGLIQVAKVGSTWKLTTAGSLGVARLDCSRAELAMALEIAEANIVGEPKWINTGSEQLICQLDSPSTVREAKPVPALLRKYATSERRPEGIVYVWAWADVAKSKTVARLFFNDRGAVIEDPATGSACANFGGWLLDAGVAPPFEVTVTQGEQVGRPSTLLLSVASDRRISVAGEVVELGRGFIDL